MNNEELIRKLIKSSIQLAIQESAEAVFVLIMAYSCTPWPTSGS